MQTSELLTITEFCVQANIGRTYAYKLINESQIKALKVGKKTLIPKSEISKWIENLPVYSGGGAA